MADKIIQLRKQNGWSQEELAEKLGVSRQSVSRWEGAQSVPDLARILQMAQLFGVTTDYLLKDELGEVAAPVQEEAASPELRRVSLAQAQEYLALRRAAGERLGWSILLCILSPVPLFILGALSEQGDTAFYQELLPFLGLAALLVMVAAAVYGFIRVGAASSDYEFLEKEPFETEYGVTGMVREKQAAFKESYTRGNILGVCLCILAPIFIFLGTFERADATQDLFMACMLAGMFLTVGLGVVSFVRVGTVWSSYQKLLEEGDYSREKKDPLYLAISGIYWPLITAVYLIWSFTSMKWGITWLVWPIAGVVFSALEAWVKVKRK